MRVPSCDAAVRLLPHDTEPLLYRALAHAAMGEFEKAKQDVAAALRLDPEHTFDTYGILAQVNAIEAGDAQAVAGLEQALPGATRSRQAAIYSQLALILATYPDPKIRDGRRALAAGKKACELSDRRSFWALAGLAAAYAECGDYSAAVDCQQQAVTLASSKDPSLAMSSDLAADGGMKEMERRLGLYQSGQPARAKHLFANRIGHRAMARSRELLLQIRTSLRQLLGDKAGAGADAENWR